jgi:proteasome lid subunit RPN8/RPN11
LAFPRGADYHADMTATAAAPCTLARPLVAALGAHAQEAHPDECCGFLLGAKGAGIGAAPREAVRAVNREGEGRTRFAIAPEDVLAAHRGAAARGLAVVGFYHSHPCGEARPSARDFALAWPGYVYVIVAGDALRAFVRPAHGAAFEELDVVVEDGA